MQGYPFCNSMRIHLRLVFGMVALLFGTLGVEGLLWSQPTESPHPEKTMTAVRINPEARPSKSITRSFVCSTM